MRSVAGWCCTAFCTDAGSEIAFWDPGQLVNVAENPEHAEARKKLSARLQEHLARTGDSRVLGQDAPRDYYPYYGRRLNKDWRVDLRP
jgi:hypothetical protein